MPVTGPAQPIINHANTIPCRINFLQSFAVHLEKWVGFC